LAPNAGIVAKGGNTTRQYWIWSYDQATSFEVDEGGNTNNGWTSTLGQWDYVVLTYDGSSIRTYLNGGLEGTFSQATGVIDAMPEELLLGHIPGWFFLDGNIDEVRISTVARDPQWIQTQYNTQASPPSFIAVGPEE